MGGAVAKSKPQPEDSRGNPGVAGFLSLRVLADTGRRDPPVTTSMSRFHDFEIV